jgi:hypothetical protein
LGASGRDPDVDVRMMASKLADPHGKDEEADGHPAHQRHRPCHRPPAVGNGGAGFTDVGEHPATEPHERSQHFELTEVHEEFAGTEKGKVSPFVSVPRVSFR